MASKNGDGWKNRIVGYGEEAPDQLLANPLNFRIHPRDQQSATEGSLDSLGWIDDVIVNKTTGHVVDGHLRITLALRNGAKSVPVKYVELTEAEEQQALLSIDPIAAMAATDKAKLDELIHSIQSDNEQVQRYIADLAEREGIQYGAPPPDDPGAQIDKAEELREKWGVQSGQLWKLGEHRLICGDCTDREVVERVMQGEKATMGFFDPPYGISFQSNGRTATPKFNKLHGDEEINGTWISAAIEHLENDAAIYICTRWDVYHKWREIIIKYIQLKNLIVWDKVDWSSGDLIGDYSPRHEFILYCVNGCHKLRGHRESNVWSFGAQNKQNYLHPTQKKVELPEFAISKSSDPGNVIIDWFLGSGTTLIACERLGRKCRAVEISPAYCAVAIQRWVDMTQGTPELIG